MCRRRSASCQSWRRAGARDPRPADRVPRPRRATATRRRARRRWATRGRPATTIATPPATRRPRRARPPRRARTATSSAGAVRTNAPARVQSSGVASGSNLNGSSRRSTARTSADGGVCRIPEIDVVEVVVRCRRHMVTPSRSRSRRKPRCRFTRTESGVRPVTAAISGPDSPSTSRSTRVSR